MDNCNIKVLNYVYENSSMGVNTISKILENISDKTLISELSDQRDKYYDFACLAKDGIIEHGGEVKPVSKFTAIMSDLMIDMKTLTDTSPSKIAEMIMQGSTMGIISATKTIKENDCADSKVLDLTRRLLDFENKQFKDMKAFL